MWRTSRCDGPTTQRRLSRIRGMIKVSMPVDARLARRRMIKRTPRRVAAWHERPTGVCRNLNPFGNAIRIERTRLALSLILTLPIKSKLFQIVAPYRDYFSGWKNARDYFLLRQIFFYYDYFYIKFYLYKIYSIKFFLAFNFSIKSKLFQTVTFSS